MSNNLPSDTKHKRVKYKHDAEPFTVINLEDGTVIKLRINVFGVVLALEDDGKTPKKGVDGAPLYGVITQVVQFVDTFETVPEGVKLS